MLPKRVPRERLSLLQGYLVIYLRHAGWKKRKSTFLGISRGALFKSKLWCLDLITAFRLSLPGFPTPARKRRVIGAPLLYHEWEFTCLTALGKSQYRVFQPLLIKKEVLSPYSKGKKDPIASKDWDSCCLLALRSSPDSRDKREGKKRTDRGYLTRRGISLLSSLPTGLSL